MNTKIELPNSNIQTSNIGFGTSRLLGSALTDKGRLILLEQVYDLGITHFDTAPLYGWGKAESLLGKFIQNKRNSITLTTKYGLNPNILPWHLRTAAPIGRFLTNNSATIKKFMASFIERKYTGPAHRKSGANTADLATNKSNYSKQDINEKLHESLKNFNTDCIDIYLLHECIPEDINGELIQWLNEFIQAGKIKTYGLATTYNNALTILQNHPNFKGVVQVHHSILGHNDRIMACSNNQLTITHSIFKDSITLLSERLFKNEASINHFSSLIDFDLNQPGALQKIIISIASRQNAKGIKLFSSQNLDHIKTNVDLFANPVISTRKSENLLDKISPGFGDLLKNNAISK